MTAYQAPDTWVEAAIGDVCSLRSGGTPSRKNPAYWNGDIPWIKTGEVDYCCITDTEERITPLGLKESSATLFPEGTLLMAMYGQGVTRGKVAITGLEAATNQACAAITPTNLEDLTIEFLYWFLRYLFGDN